MAATDRAFRALGRDEPATLVALIEAVFPSLLPEGIATHALTGRDGRLDTPDPSLEADAVFADEHRPLLWHIEGQGYGDERFLERVVRYHLGFVLRHWERQVKTLVVWLQVPRAEERLPLLRKGDVSVLVQHLVLREVPARVLVQNERTACFATGGDDEGRGDGVVCQQAVAVLRDSNASLRRWQMAAVSARSHGKERYRAMVKAMEQADVRSVIIEDLLKIGEEFGVEKGYEKGLTQGALREARRSVERVLVQRRIELTTEQQAQLASCDDLTTLGRWLDQAIVASSADDALR